MSNEEPTFHVQLIPDREAVASKKVAAPILYALAITHKDFPDGENNYRGLFKTKGEVTEEVNRLKQLFQELEELNEVINTPVISLVE